MNICLEVNFTIIISKGSIDNTSYSLKVMVLCQKLAILYRSQCWPFWPTHLCATWSPWYKQGLTWIPAWLSNDIHHKMWDEITNPFPNFNVRTVECCEWTSNFIPHLTVYLITFPCQSMLLKGAPVINELNNKSERLNIWLLIMPAHDCILYYIWNDIHYSLNTVLCFVW